MKESVIEEIIPKQLFDSLWISESYRVIGSEISITHYYIVHATRVMWRIES
jgi:hypothetical protein